MSDFVLLAVTGLGLGALYFLAASGSASSTASWASSTSPTARS